MMMITLLSRYGTREEELEESGHFFDVGLVNLGLDSVMFPRCISVDLDESFLVDAIAEVYLFLGP